MCRDSLPRPSTRSALRDAPHALEQNVCSGRVQCFRDARSGWSMALFRFSKSLGFFFFFFGLFVLPIVDRREFSVPSYDGSLFFYTISLRMFGGHVTEFCAESDPSRRPVAVRKAGSRAGPGLESGSLDFRLPTTLTDKHGSLC